MRHSLPASALWSAWLLRDMVDLRKGHSETQFLSTVDELLKVANPALRLLEGVSKYMQGLHCKKVQSGMEATKTTA